MRLRALVAAALLLTALSSCVTRALWTNIERVQESHTEYDLVEASLDPSTSNERVVLRLEGPPAGHARVASSRLESKLVVLEPPTVLRDRVDRLETLMGNSALAHAAWHPEAWAAELFEVNGELRYLLAVHGRLEEHASLAKAGATGDTRVLRLPPSFDDSRLLRAFALEHDPGCRIVATFDKDLRPNASATECAVLGIELRTHERFVLIPLAALSASLRIEANGEDLMWSIYLRGHARERPSAANPLAERPALRAIDLPFAGPVGWHRRWQKATFGAVALRVAFTPIAVAADAAGGFLGAFFESAVEQLADEAVEEGFRGLRKGCEELDRRLRRL